MATLRIYLLFILLISMANLENGITFYINVMGGLNESCYLNRKIIFGIDFNKVVLFPVVSSKRRKKRSEPCIKIRINDSVMCRHISAKTFR